MFPLELSIQYAYTFVNNDTNLLKNFLTSNPEFQMKQILYQTQLASMMLNRKKRNKKAWKNFSHEIAESGKR